MDNAFKVVKDGQTFDYRVPKTLDLTDVANFFSVHYKVGTLMQTGRHVTGLLNDGKQDLFLKLSTTPGISIVSRNEYKWNEEFNKHEHSKFKAPKNTGSGEYKGLFYFLAEVIKGELLGSVEKTELHSDFEALIPDLIDFADYISSLHIQEVGRPDLVTGTNPHDKFVKKTKSWLDSIPAQIQNRYGLVQLFAKVEADAPSLTSKARHGDFTPWHLMKTPNELVILDGEHAMSDGVELYDIAYLTQRVHTISNKPELAQKIINEAEVKGHSISKLKTVLSARAIGGYLDAHLAGKTDFLQETSFRDWVISL